MSFLRAQNTFSISSPHFPLALLQPNAQSTIFGVCAEYSRSLMREAKAHFEGATAAATLAESPSTSSEGSSRPSAASTSSQATESGRLHLTARDSTSSLASASQDADATDNSPSNLPQTSGSAGGLEDAMRNPQTALAAAHKATKQPGSSTALVLQFKEGSNILKASNLVCSRADKARHDWAACIQCVEFCRVCPPQLPSPNRLRCKLQRARSPYIMSKWQIWECSIGLLDLWSS